MAVKNDVYLNKFYTQIMKQRPMMYDHQFIITFSGRDLPAPLVSNPNNFSSPTYYIKSGNAPQPKMSSTQISFLSQKFVVPRQITQGGAWSINMLLDEPLTQYRNFYNWQQQFASLRLDGGGTHRIPYVNAHVKLLDASLQNINHEFILVGVFPTKIPEISMQYQNQSSVMELSFQLTYQYVYYVNQAGGMDPLGASSIQ